MSTYNSPDDIAAQTLARSSTINDLDAAVAAAFALLPDEDDLKHGTVCYDSDDAGEADAYEVDLPNTPSGYVDGLMVIFKPAYTNTGASTINVNSMGVKTIKRAGDLDLVAGDIAAQIPTILIYNASTGYFYFPNEITRLGDSDCEGDILINATNIAANAATIVANKAEEEFRNFIPLM
jgi:hypothetical protein